MDYMYYSVLNFRLVFSIDIFSLLLKYFFSSDKYTELELWEDFKSAAIYIETAPTWSNLLYKMTSFFGRQPLPPKWLYNGAVVGLQGGTEKVFVI